MRKPALVTERASHRRGPDALHARPVIRHRSANDQVIHVDIEALLLRGVGRILNGRAQHLLHDRPHPLGGEVNGVERLLHAHALNGVEDQLRLLRAAALKLGFCAELSNFVCCNLRHNFDPSNCLVRLASANINYNERRTLLRFYGGLGCARGVALERARRGELAQLMTDHVLRYIHWNEFAAVMHGNGVADHVREDRRAARPGAHNLLVVGLVHDRDLRLKMRVDERALLC